jgi:hypothetical protein
VGRRGIGNLPGSLRRRAGVNLRRHLTGWALVVAAVLTTSPVTAAEPPGSTNFTAPSGVPDFFSNEGGAGRGAPAAAPTPAPAPAAVVAAPGPSRATASAESERPSYAERSSYRGHRRHEVRSAHGHAANNHTRGGRLTGRSRGGHVQAVAARQSGSHAGAAKGHTAAARGHAIAGKEKRAAHARG